MLWKKIEEFPGYLVSDTGEVKSTKYWGQFKRVNKDGTLKQRTYKSGYKYVNLYKNGHMYSIKVHRLVASCFIPNPNNYPQVNHKDEDKGNNCVSNLEWCNASYNLSYNNLQTKMHLKQKRKIGAYNNRKELILIFDSATDAVNYLVKQHKTKSFRSAIGNVCYAAHTNLSKISYGYYWNWLEESKRR